MKKAKIVFHQLEAELAQTLPMVDQLVRQAVQLQTLLRDHPMSVTAVVEALREVQQKLYDAQRRLDTSRYLPL